MKRILIFGNSGSGKTWLASRLSSKGKQYISLDDIFWVPSGYNEKRSTLEISQEIRRIKDSTGWVVEGVFGELLGELISIADMVVFLDLSWEKCEENLLRRGSESSKQLDKLQAETNFQELINWASDYANRNTKSSYIFHKLLYEQFEREKYILSCRKEVNQFLHSYYHHRLQEKNSKYLF